MLARKAIQFRTLNQSSSKLRQSQSTKNESLQFPQMLARKAIQFQILNQSLSRLRPSQSTKNEKGQSALKSAFKAILYRPPNPSLFIPTQSSFEKRLLSRNTSRERNRHRQNAEYNVIQSLLLNRSSSDQTHSSFRPNPSLSLSISSESYL